MIDPTNAAGWFHRADHLDKANYGRRALYAYRQAFQHGEREHLGDDWLMGVSRSYRLCAERFDIDVPPIGDTSKPEPIYDASMSDKIQAIKQLRERTGWNLRRSKDVVEATRAVVDVAALTTGLRDVGYVYWSGTLQDYLESLAALGRLAQAILDTPETGTCEQRYCERVVPATTQYCWEHTAPRSSRWTIAEYPLSDSPTGQAIGETS